MEAALGETGAPLGAEKKAWTFGKYLEDIGLAAKQVLAT